MKKILALLLVLALSLTLVACGSGKKDAASTGSYKVAMVTDYGDITDQSFNQTTWEAVVAFGIFFVDERLTLRNHPHQQNEF